MDPIAMSSLSLTLLHTSCPKQSDLKVVLIEIPCVLQKGKEEAGPQMLRDKVNEGSWPGPRRRPETGEGLCKSSLFEQPTKRQREGRGQLCHRKEVDQREQPCLCSALCLLPQGGIKHIINSTLNSKSLAT